MLGLTLRKEFQGKRLKGTAIELANEKNTGATQVPAAEFLEITYPSGDLLKSLEAVGPNQGRPLVLIGERGQGKSHLMAALYHALTDAQTTLAWLQTWGTRLGDTQIATLPLRSGMKVISESLHRQRYKFLWDLLFDNHPHGQFIRGKWEGLGEKKTEVPPDTLIIELLQKQPVALLLDEFQTWFDGLTNTKQYPWRNWAFNFIQVLSEIAKDHPELLVLVVSVRNGTTDAYQQIHRVNPVRVDFKGPHAEALKGHSRDLLLLSATPHQGEHFRFWMLIQLLNPTLFRGPEDMVENRHRLNVVVFRRTKADACRPDGSSLFARRWVHTESFVMSDEERRFYEELRAYLEDGFALAKNQGNQGRALGFVMTIFQKIAASSFAAVRRTLRRRLLMLTLFEAILRDRDLDIEGRETLYKEAKALIREEWDFDDTPIGRSQVDRILADLKLRIVKRLDEDELERASDPYATEFAAAHAEEVAASTVSLALPEERLRIRDLLTTAPESRETKVEKLLLALGTLWRENPQEKVVIFATYLGTVELLGREIEAAYPGQGVVVLRGGDHGAKLAAERRFRQHDGPKVLVCTAAGREGINLQFARILFNFDLPWNPMDVEQRIGRIHRYGQVHTAQVYNLVLSDTIEGRIFLLLNDKLLEIAKTLGKVDEKGDIAEYFRAQILGQLSERLSYDQLYRDALSDPELRRTRLELEAALGNATEARKVVFELFQDLEGFRLEDYQPFADVTADIDRLVQFLSVAVGHRGRRVVRVAEDIFELQGTNGEVINRFTTKRELARERADSDLVGLDHPLVDEELRFWRSLPPQEVGVAVEGDGEATGVLSWWLIESQGKGGEQRIRLQPLAVRWDGARMPRLERLGEAVLRYPPTSPALTNSERMSMLREYLEPMLSRELQHAGVVKDGEGFSTRLVGWVEVQPHSIQQAVSTSLHQV